nr:DnaJ homolog subfamily B member 3 [Tanacetum cinerariifolium]
MDGSSCYYSVLGLPKDASSSDIRSAYRKLALEWHPDKWTNKPSSLAGEANRRFQKIQEAYSVLSDQSKKSMYDAGGLDLFDDIDDNEGMGDFLHDLMKMMDQNQNAGPQSLCNACGIRFKKKGPRQPSPPSSSSSATVGSRKEDFSPPSDGCVEEMKDGKYRRKLRIKIVALGKEVVLIQRPRSPMKKVVRKHFRNIQIQNQYKNLGEVEQAAHLLMSLSCGSVFG